MARDGARARPGLAGRRAFALILVPLLLGTWGEPPPVKAHQDPVESEEARKARRERDLRCWELVRDGVAALAPPNTDLEGARALFEAAAQIDGAPNCAQAWVYLASIERLSGRPWQGLALLEEGKRRLDAIVGHRQIATETERLRLLESVRCYLKLGVPDVAYDDAEAALRIAETSKFRFDATLASLDMMLAQGDPVAAKRLATEALADADLVRSGRRNAEPKLQLRLLMAERNLVRTPAEFASVAEELAALRSTGLHRRLRLRASLVAVDCWLEAGDLEQAARQNAELGVPVEDGPKRVSEVYAQRARIAIARGADIEELGALRDLLAAAVAGWFEEWRKRPVRDGGSGPFLFGAHRDVLATQLLLDKIVLRGDAAFEAAFDHAEAALTLGALSRRLVSGKPATMSEARRLVPENGGLLIYALGRRSGSLLTMDEEGVAHHTLDLDRAHRLRSLRLQDAVDNPPAQEIVAGGSLDVIRLAGRVTERLLPEAAQERVRGWQRIVLVGAESSSALFQSLRWGDSWLCLEKELLHAPSVAVALGLRDRAAARREVAADRRLDLVMVGDPLIDDESARRWLVETLGLSDMRRAKFTQAFTAARHRARWGGAASTSSLSDPDVLSARALCLFTHGVQNYGRERSAGLLLTGRDGRAEVLYADDVERLRVPPLVLLGVCGASKGPVRMGDDGANHLGGAFLLAGADCVALAHGDLSVGATRDLLADTLAAWKGGESMAAAMRRARIGIASDPERAHPYFFAGLRLVGIDVAPPPE